MKKTAVLFLAAAIVGGSLRAEETSDYSITLDFPYVSKYVFRGVQLADDVIQPSVEFAAGDFYAGIWTSQPVSGGYTNEFDFYLGYGAKLSDMWSLDVGATYYYYPETPSGDESFEPFVGVSGDFGGGITGTGYLYYDTELEITTYQLGIGYSMDLSPKSTLDFAGDYGYVATAGGEDYGYWSLSATANYKLTEKASTYFGVNWSDADLSGEDSHFWVNAGISMGF